MFRCATAGRVHIIFSIRIVKTVRQVFYCKLKYNVQCIHDANCGMIHLKFLNYLISYHSKDILHTDIIFCRQYHHATSQHNITLLLFVIYLSQIILLWFKLPQSDQMDNKRLCMNWEINLKNFKHWSNFWSSWMSLIRVIGISSQMPHLSFKRRKELMVQAVALIVNVYCLNRLSICSSWNLLGIFLS